MGTLEIMLEYRVARMVLIGSGTIVGEEGELERLERECDMLCYIIQEGV